MGKLQEIEAKLLAVNDAVFQNICDDILFYTEKDFKEMYRTGSQLAKQKTIKGIPDMYIVVPSGQYIFVDYTTQSPSNKTAFIKKVNKDLADCLDESNHGIPLRLVDKIIYCCLGVPLPEEHQAYIQLCKAKGVDFKLMGISEIAETLLHRCPHIARNYLEVNIDTGQVLPLPEFIRQYEHTGIATPLSNEFFGREKELEQLTASLESYSITILTGPAGTGKSRLALEAMQKAAVKKKDTKLICITNKGPYIHEDLIIYLAKDEQFIIFVDDANRQVNHLSSLLALMREPRKHPLRVIATVRDYALAEIEARCDEFQPNVIRIDKMEDESLVKVISSGDFKVYHQWTISRILEIADGNPRLAVMAARLAHDREKIKGLFNTSALYDEYFKQILRDTGILSDACMLKTLGIISFFHAVNTQDGPFMQSLQIDFGLSAQAFMDAAEKLEGLEMVETSPDRVIIKISEQVLATYFFYKTFLAERKLDLLVILKKYFTSNPSKLKDSIIPVNNAFGYNLVYEKIMPTLREYWQSIQADRPAVFTFLSTFWFYFPDETICFVYGHLSTIIPEDKKEFIYDEKIGSHSLDTDKYFGLLLPFFAQQQNLLDAVGLAFAFVGIVPSLYSKLVHRCRQDFSFRREDELTGFERQHVLLDYLRDGLNRREPALVSAFFEIIPGLLQTVPSISASGRKKFTITFYRYCLRAVPEVLTFREKAWHALTAVFSNFPTAARGFLRNYLQPSPDYVKELYNYDLPFLFAIYRRQLNPRLFEDCYIVQDSIYWFKRIGLQHNEFERLVLKFTNETYRCWLVLCMDRLRGRADATYERKNGEKLKETELRKAYKFVTVSQWRTFYKKYLVLAEWEKRNQHSLNQSLDIILAEQVRHKPSLGLRWMVYIIEQGNAVAYIPWLAIKALQAHPEHRVKLLAVMMPLRFKYKILWAETLLRFTTMNEVAKSDIQFLLDAMQDADCYTYFDFSILEKYTTVWPSVFHDVLKKITDGDENEGKKLRLHHDFFEQYIAFFDGRLSLVKKAYFLMDGLNDHFDHNCHDCLLIIEKDPGFIEEYLAFYTRPEHHLRTREHNGLTSVWRLSNAEAIVEKAFDFLHTRDYYTAKEDFCNVFFNHLADAVKERAVLFLFYYLEKHVFERDRLDTLFDCVRHSFKDRLKGFIHRFLSLNKEIEDFKVINWYDGFYFGRGDVNVSALRMGQMKQVLEMLPEGYKYAKHRAYLRHLIHEAQENSMRESRQLFMEQDF